MLLGDDLIDALDTLLTTMIDESEKRGATIIGRYVLRPEIFDILETTAPGKGGEIQLTDALQHLAQNDISGGVYGVIFDGRRYDTGDRSDRFVV